MIRALLSRLSGLVVLTCACGAAHDDGRAATVAIVPTAAPSVESDEARPARLAKPQDTVTIAVLGVATDDAFDQAEALGSALRAAIRSSKELKLADMDIALEVVALSLKCAEPIDEACEARIADAIKADRYIWARIAKKGPSVAGELHFWVRGARSRKTPIEYSATLTDAHDEALRMVVGRSLAALVDQ